MDGMSDLESVKIDDEDEQSGEQGDHQLDVDSDCFEAQKDSNVSSSVDVAEQEEEQKTLQTDSRNEIDQPLFDDSNDALKRVDLNDKKVNKNDEKSPMTADYQKQLRTIRRCNLKIADLDLE